ncbi:MAG: hypothetical protein JSR45_06690 [Proteobacteria bacterium]|nr:hypothetical protein [Pseudomonadota bacterium]
MPENKDKGPDRRTLIAAAAAAGAVASPLVAQAAGPAMARKPPPTKIQVDLGGISLPPADAEALQSQIRRAVLDAIARAGVKANEVPHGLNPGWLGIVVRPVQIPQVQGAKTHGVG